MKIQVLEDMLRVVHFGAQAVMTVFVAGQNIVWFTDCDNIVANDKYAELFGKIAEATIKTGFLPGEKIGLIGFGLTSTDDGTLEIEDFAAVPDLVAGALCEVLDSLVQANLRITPRVILKKPIVSNKTNLICDWMGKSRCPLKKFHIVFDRMGADILDWRPTLFYIRNEAVSACEITCNAQLSASFVSDPVRFDIAERSES